MKKILVLGSRNDCRSLMMEGWLKYYVGKEAEIYSAGCTSGEINMFAMKVMMDAMIDISGYISKGYDELEEKVFDYIINLAEENGKEMIAGSGGNPVIIEKTSQDCLLNQGDEEEIMTKLAAIRDSFEDFCFDFVNENIRNLIPGEMDRYKKSIQ